MTLPSPSQTLPASPLPLRSLVTVFLCSFTLSLIGIALSRMPGTIATLWYANAAGTMFMLAHPTRAWPAVLVAALGGNLAANLVVGDSLLVSLSFLPGNGIEILLAATLLNRLGGCCEAYKDPVALLRLFCIGGLIPMLVGATLGAATLAWHGYASFQHAWPKWFEGALIGTVSILPLGFFILRQGSSAVIAMLKDPVAIAMMVGAAGVALVGSSAVPYPFISIAVPLAFLAVRGGFLITALATFLASICIGTLIAQGLLSPPGMDANWTHIHFYFGLLLSLVPALLLAASIEGGRGLMRDLESARQRAEQAFETKSRFLANMSHEIRTPLSATMGILDLLNANPPEARRQQLVTQLRTATQNLRTVVDDILDYSRAEAGLLQLESTPFSPHSLCNDLREVQLARLSAEQGPSLSVKLDRTLPPQLIGDAFRLRQVLMNLLDNAVKFTPAGRIELELRQTRHQGNYVDIEFSVTDTGIGIPAAQQQQIFEAFSQADPSISRRFGGTGLGLSICQRIVSQMGGEIKLESREGQGSRFYFTLQLPIATQTDKQATNLAAPSRRLQGVRILLVEDNDLGGSILSALLQQEGAAVRVAENGLRAVSLLEHAENAFDVVLMDLHMPILDGLEATRNIRSQTRLATLPVLAMTADVLPETRQKCLEAGMNGHLGKPLDIDQLCQTLTALQASGWQELAQPLAVAAPTAELDLRDTLRRLGNNAALFLRSARRFIDEYATLTSQLAAWRESNQIAQIDNTLHNLKGNAATLGMAQLAAHAQSLRQRSSSLQSADIDSLTATLSDALSQLKAAVQRLETASCEASKA